MKTRSTVLVAALAAVLLAPSADAKIAVGNLKPGEVLYYPVPLISGTLDPAATSIEVRNTHPSSTGEVVHGVVRDGQFKAVTELVPGKNRIELSAGGEKTVLELTYKLQTTPYTLRFFYVTDNTGETKYISPIENDPQNFREKMDASAKLMQSFCAESMMRNGHGRRTFNLEYDEKGKLVVHVIKSPKPRTYFHENSSFAWYGHVSHLVNQKFPAGNKGPGRMNRNMALINVTEFDKEQGKVVGGVALGAPGLALFGSGSLYTWPNTVGDTFRAFSDATPIDSKHQFDDSAGRSAHWALASTSIGACVHEFGHGFGLPHTKDGLGIMSRGFDHFARMFNLVEPPSRHSKDAKPVDEAKVARWSTGYAAQLRWSPFLNMVPPKEPGDDKPVIKRIAGTDKIEVTSRAGLVWLALYDFNGGDLYLDDKTVVTFKKPYPKRKVLSIAKSTELAGTGQFSVSAVDCLGTRVFGNPRDIGLGFKAEEKSLTTGKPVTVSQQQKDFPGERAVDGSVHKDSRWDANPYPQWLQVDLKKREKVGKVRLVPYWDGRRFYQYTVELSTDGRKWKTVADMSENTDKATKAGHVHEFEPEAARYIRVTMLKNSANAGVHIVELHAWEK